MTTRPKSRFMFKDRWLIMKVVFLHSTLNWGKDTLFLLFRNCRVGKVDTKSPPSQCTYYDSFFVTFKLYP